MQSDWSRNDDYWRTRHGKARWEVGALEDGVVGTNFEKQLAAENKVLSNSCPNEDKEMAESKTATAYGKQVSPEKAKSL